MKDGVLNISKALILRAAQDKEFLETLSFVIIIKASHRNSMLLNSSTKKVMGILNCNSTKAKEILANATKEGLIRKTGAQSQHIVAAKLERKDKEKTVRLNVHKNDDGTLHLYLKSNFKEKKEFSPQTIADVKNLILAIAVLIGIDKHNGFIITRLNSGNSNGYSLRNKEERCCSKWRKDRNAGKLKDREISKVNKGYSYGEMLEHTFRDHIGVYKLKQLIKFLKKERLIKVLDNIIPLKKIEEGGPSDINDFAVTDKDKGKKYVYTARNGYIAIHKKKFQPSNCILSDELTKRSGEERMACIKFAYNYLNTSDYLKLTKQGRKWPKKKKMSNQKTECRSMENIDCKSLPFWG